VSSTVIVASPSFVVHSPASLEKSLKDVYAQKSSIDKDIEEVQAALEAAGLSRLGETPQKDPQERGDIDIQSLLREITREEVISTSKQILHEQWKKASKSTPSASKPLPQSNKGDRSSSTGKTPIPTSHKKAPTTPSSRLPIRVRKLGDTPAMEKHHRLSNPVLNGNKKVSEDTVVIGAIDPSFHARELKLLEELSSLKEICEKEKKDRSEMEAKWMAREKEILQREEMVKLEHQKELKEIKAEMFTLSAKLREKNIREDTRKNLAQSGAVDDLSPEEKDRLEKEIKGQEKLLEGYQKENERLYHDLTRVQQELKSSKDLLTQENQILRTELANERAKQEIRLPPSHPPVHSTVLAPPSDGRVDALEDHLDRVQHENKKLHNKVVQLEQMVAAYETDIRAVAKERDELKKSITSLMPLDMVEGLKEKHRVEIVALEGKLKWYSENQRLFEQDADILRGKEEQIKELSWKLETAEEHIRNQKKVAKERGTDAKRIRDLERQIKEMETIIRRRFPNSITAMIYASSHDDKEGQKSESGTPQTSLYLERKVRALEKELEEKDEEHSRRTRALQQQYIAMEVSYEEEVKKLKGKVAEFKRLTASSKSEAQPHTTVHSLQKELERRKVVYQTRLAELQQEVSRLKRGGNKMADLTNRQVDEAVLGKKDVMHEEEEGAVDVFRKELVVRKREYQTIRKERDSLYQQVEKLCDTVREAEKEIAHYKEKSQSDLDQKQVDVMRQENEVLKDQLRQLQLASTQERVHLQNQLAQTETKSRQVKEDLEDKIGEIQEQHRKEVGHLVAKHAKEHSESVLIKMKAQLANQKVEIAHLKEKLEASQFDVEALIACKLREKGLEEKLRALALELIEAKRYHSPVS
jgi:protein QN1